MPTPTSTTSPLQSLLQEAAHLSSLAQLGEWDQETYMPDAAAPARAQALSILATLIHERRTSPKLGRLLQAAASKKPRPGSPEAAMLREARRDYDIHTKLPAKLVADLARLSSEAQQVWKVAREKSDFSLFRPTLEKMIALQRTKARYLGVKPGGEPYDALLDLYEPGMTAREVESVFTPLRQRLAALISSIRQSRVKVSTKCLSIKLDPAAQHAFGQDVLAALGFDMAAGRLDTTTHPFCSGFAPGDTRLTTRYRENHFTGALYGTLHEMGHGLYEQGLPKSAKDGSVSVYFGTPLSEAVSLGIHESQSRMWENFVGRSKAFWKWAIPRSKPFFGRALAKYSPDDYYAAVNTTTPSFIRVEADETTYNLHIMIRFELERAIISGDLAVKDIPSEWNARYKDYLGVKVPDDRRGCLQDVHWAAGLFGYFPTYTLGNLYAAQLWEQIADDIPDLQKRIARGDFAPLKTWLHTNIHRHGRRYEAKDLCRRATGRALSADPLLRHLSAKARDIYGV